MTKGVGFILLVLLGALPCAAAQTDGGPPSIYVETNPFAVRGTHFHAGERVMIVVRTRKRSERVATADVEGSFAVEFPIVRFDECVGYAVKAAGNRGSRATRKLRPAECAESLSSVQSHVGDARTAR